MDKVQADIMHLIPKLCQRQDSTIEQLEDLIPVAQKLGSYDAADFLRKFIESGKKISEKKVGEHV